MNTVAADPDAPRCPTCDYNLTALTSPTCPECGHALPAALLLSPAAALSYCIMSTLYEHLI